MKEERSDDEVYEREGTRRERNGERVVERDVNKYKDYIFK